MGQPTGYVLKFISGKYQGGEFPLEYDREIHIGRGSDLDMVLVEDMVSRRHARITTHGGEFTIEDLGSTNGTFVNGEKISRAKLKDGDRILVGTSIIKLVPADGETEVTEEVTDLPDNAYNPKAKRQPATSTGSIAGKIEEVPLPDLLQLFSSSRKTGVLIVTSDREGRVYLKDGRVVYATVDGEPMSAEKAFYRILWMRQGTFVLEPEDGREVPEDGIMEMSMEALMMEGIRQLDEIENLGADVPGLNDVLVVANPLLPPLRSLSPELLDTLQLVMNHRLVEDILNRSLAPDLDTMQDIMYLLRNDYLKSVSAV